MLRRTLPAILEVKETLSGQRHEFACRCLAVTGEVAVLLYELRRAWQIVDLTVPSGTLSVGYYWTARPYNVYHWLAADGATLGLYVNISDRTAISPDQIYWRDLIVDLLVTPDGRCRVLDEDELPADLDAALCRTIDAARDDVLANYPALLAEVERRSAELLRSVDQG